MTSPKPTKPEDSLGPFREKIDRIDSEILSLLHDRAKCVLRVGKLKQEDRLASVYVPRRERDIFERLAVESDGPFPASAIPAVFREIISACRSLETPLGIAYLGPPASFCHQAALLKFGNSANFYPCESFSEVFRVVEKGECHYGVVAIRNSTHGVIPETLDNFQRSSLQIYAETHLDIRHQFLSISKPDEILRIYSHGHAFPQCREWLEKHYGRCELREVASTSIGAQMASREPGTAAIASALASKIYMIPILFPNIEDRTHNTTRFVVVGNDSERPTGRDKTSMIAHLRNRPGALFGALEPFRDSGINLTHIDSRPTKAEQWEYLFFIEFEGHVEEERVQRALEKLRDHCLHLKLLGSYPDEEQSRSVAKSAPGVED